MYSKNFLRKCSSIHVSHFIFSLIQVARYNSAAQHQTIQHTVVSPLLKSRNEVLHLIEILAKKQYSDVADLIIPLSLQSPLCCFKTANPLCLLLLYHFLIIGYPFFQVGEILVHCLDTSLLKHKSLAEIFPPITG